MSRVLNSLYRLEEGEMEEEIPKAGDFSGHEKYLRAVQFWPRKPKKIIKKVPLCVCAPLLPQL